MLSVILPTIHPGGMDFIVDSFAKNSKDWDYELLVVDDWPGRAERGLAEKYLRMSGVKLGWYGNSKPKGEGPGSVCGWVRAVNTAFEHVRGDYVVIMQDYTTLTPDWFLRWHQGRVKSEREFGNRKFLIVGTAIMYTAPKPKSYDDIISWPDQPDVWLHRHLLIFHPWVPDEFETFYWGFPMEFIEEINGFDERADHCGPWINNSVQMQAKVLEYKTKIELAMVCQMIDHRIWDKPGEEPHPYGIDDRIGMWKVAGEFRSLKEEPEWSCPSSNKFSLKELRKEK